GQKFCDANLSIHTDNPDLTPCFQNTILAWIPSIYLWTALPFYLLYLKRSKRGYIVLSMLSRFKTVRSLQCSASDCRFGWGLNKILSALWRD
uniref:Uncharacterized protein n=1 Tax=Meleagris gallopavo TaxID=9103 RepID=A0A803Y4F8_MELGA